MASTPCLPPARLDAYDWHRRAACRTAEGDVFFSPDGERGPTRRTREQQAKVFCAACPVRVECLGHALAAGEHYGIWGGLTEHERRHLALPPHQAA